MTNLKTIEKANKTRAIISIVICSLVVIFVFIALMIRLFYNGSDNIAGTEGLMSYRMFTIDSNILCALCAVLCIPYEIDGLRTGDFHLPRWIVYTLFTGVTCVSLTFVVAVCILAPVAGVYNILFNGSNLYMHLICPILEIAMFLFVTTDHTIKWKWTFVAMAPIIVYALTYMFMTFIFNIWNDHYQFDRYIPWPATFVLMMGIAFGLTTLLRTIHNKQHKNSNQLETKHYQECQELDCKTIEEAIKNLALANKSTDKNEGNMIVPRRIIALLEDKYKSGKDISELCVIYMNEYYK